MKYNTFEEWFNEVENYSTRGERFYDELKGMAPQRGVEWLRAVWECAQSGGESIIIDRACHERGCVFDSRLSDPSEAVELKVIEVKNERLG